MRKTRGLIALAVSILLAFLAAKAVYWQMNKPRPQPEKTSALLPPPKPKRFSASVAAGMRSFSVTIDKTGLSAKLRRGDRVDLVATTPLPGDNGGHVSRVLLENIEILDIDRGDAAGGKKNAARTAQWTVALLVTPEQGVTLAAASAASRIALMARNGKDPDRRAVLAAAYTTDKGAEMVRDGTPGDTDAIPEGMRAITIAVRRIDGMAGRLHPRDRVDVLTTCPYSRFSSDTNQPGGKGEVTEYRLASRTVLQNIEVLSTEKDAALNAGLPEAVQYVTLLVTPAQAEIVTVATDASKKVSLRLISRNRMDDGRVATGGQLLSDVLLPRKHQWNHHIPVHHGQTQTMRYFK